jgi:hypothetical protein
MLNNIGRRLRQRLEWWEAQRTTVMGNEAFDEEMDQEVRADFCR